MQARKDDETGFRAPVAGDLKVLNLSGGAGAGAGGATAVGVAAEEVEGGGVVQHQLLQPFHLLAARRAHQHALAAARNLRTNSI